MLGNWARKGRVRRCGRKPARTEAWRHKERERITRPAWTIPKTLSGLFSKKKKTRSKREGEGEKRETHSSGTGITGEKGCQGLREGKRKGKVE